MQGIKVQRYAAPTEAERAAILAEMEADGHTQSGSPFPSDTWGGIIEPDDGSWIIFLDTDGRPSHYYPERDTVSGAVLCKPILLKDIPVVPDLRAAP